jgi:hypothetical protein
MSPKPTVEKTVTVKYKASVWVSGWVKFTRGGSFHHEVRRGEQQQVEGNDQTHLSLGSSCHSSGSLAR